MAAFGYVDFIPHGQLGDEKGGGAHPRLLRDFRQQLPGLLGLGSIFFPQVQIAGFGGAHRQYQTHGAEEAASQKKGTQLPENGQLQIPEVGHGQVEEEGPGAVGVLEKDGVLILVIRHQINQYKGDEEHPFSKTQAHKGEEAQGQQHLQEKEDFVRRQDLGQHIGWVH